MAALTARRANRLKKYSHLDLVGTAQAVWHGGVACFDTSTGLVAKAAISTTMIPIGLFTKSETVAASGVVTIELFKEISAIWMANLAAAPVLAANVGGLCYLADDQSVRVDDVTNTASVAGRVWAIDTIKGVLVEPHMTAGDRLGGLDA